MPCNTLKQIKKKLILRGTEEPNLLKISQAVECVPLGRGQEQVLSVL